jgi:site-specific DNA recombinase
MLADLDAGAIDGVVVWKLDRLVRNHRDFERFEEIRSGRGALLAAVHDPIDTSTEIGMMIVRLLVSFARLESANNSLRTSAAMAESAKLGRLPGGGSRPFGYRRVPAVRENGKIIEYPTLAIIPEERELVCDAARAVLEQGASLTGIAHDWNTAGVPTPAGGMWYTSQVRRLLTSPRIAGLREHHGEIVAEATWPPLIDRDTFDRLVARIEGRALKQGRPHKYLLSGVLRCGHCKQPMTGASHRPNKAKPNGASEYRCLVVPGPKRCGKISVAAQAVDDLVAEEIAQRYANYQPEPADDHEAELVRQIEADKERLAEVGREYADGAIPVETMRAAVERLEARIGATSRRLARSTTVVVPTCGADAIREAFGLRRADGAEQGPARSMAWRRQFVARVIDYIEVKPATVRGGPFDGDRIEVHWAKRRPA